MLITPNKALDIILHHVRPAKPLRLPLSKVSGHYLAEDLRSDRDQPAADRSAMDGFAVRSADLSNAPCRLRLIGEVAAGSPARPKVLPGTCVRILTGANVPPCAFDESEPRLAGRCQADQCCVGENGSGQAPPLGGGGMCTLSFRIGGDGSGLTDGVIRGIQALARFATYTITPVFHDSPSNPSDGRCFIHSVEVAEVIQPSECIPQLEFADRDEDGFEESILNATPRTRVIYELVVENRDIHDFDGDLDTSEPCGAPGVYQVRMDLLGDDVTLLSSHDLTFTVEE